MGDTRVQQVQQQSVQQQSLAPPAKAPPHRGERKIKVQVEAGMLVGEAEGVPHGWGNVLLPNQQLPGASVGAGVQFWQHRFAGATVSLSVAERVAVLSRGESWQRRGASDVETRVDANTARATRIASTTALSAEVMAHRVPLGVELSAGFRYEHEVDTDNYVLTIDATNRTIPNWHGRDTSWSHGNLDRVGVAVGGGLVVGCGRHLKLSAGVDFAATWGNGTYRYGGTDVYPDIHNPSMNVTDRRSWSFSYFDRPMLQTDIQPYLRLRAEF